MISGKSIMIWNVPSVYSGDPVSIASVLDEYGFDGVCIKAGNGAWIQSPNTKSFPYWGENIKKELVDTLKQFGKKVYFWHFVYGVDVLGELLTAVKQCERFNPDGYIWDVESSFDHTPRAEEKARYLTSELKKAFPKIPQGLCWWALPQSSTTGAEWHPRSVAKAFLEVCDVGMPMMYWQGRGANSAKRYFEISISLWRRFTDKPIVPIGRAYNGDGGQVDAESVEAFANIVNSSKAVNNLTGISWYSFDEALKNASVMEALKKTPKFTLSLSLEEKVNRLVHDHKSLFPELY